MSWKQGNFRGRFAQSSEAAPLARTEDLVVEDLASDGGADEVLIYDQRTDQAHCLTREAAMVWRVCDGRTRPEELAKALGFDVDLVNRALEELADSNLLDSGPLAGITRREATVKMAKVGAFAASAPLIYSILAPTPALATSEAACFKICPSGCGDCQKAGCCCCAPGGGTQKICTSDCANCQALENIVPFFHCGEQVTSVACSSGC